MTTTILQMNKTKSDRTDSKQLGLKVPYSLVVQLLSILAACKTEGKNVFKRKHLKYIVKSSSSRTAHCEYALMPAYILIQLSWCNCQSPGISSMLQRLQPYCYCTYGCAGFQQLHDTNLDNKKFNLLNQYTIIPICWCHFHRQYFIFKWPDSWVLC